MNDLPKIERAGTEDFKALKSLLNKANEYSLQKSGDFQWTFSWTAKQQLKRQLDNGDCYVIRSKDGDLMAAFSLTDEDDYMWSESGQDGTALYAHKLMKDPKIAPPHISKRLLGFAAQQTIDRGRKYLRCDAKISMGHLIAYYKDLGFKEKGRRIYPTTGQTALLLEADPAKLLKSIALVN
jgi:hypothetical protein